MACREGFLAPCTRGSPSGPLCRDPQQQVGASPHSINVLPEYSCDPRTPDKLLDGELHAHVNACTITYRCRCRLQSFHTWIGG